MSYLETENVLYNNNPTALQMISFLNEDRLTNGRGTLSNGSVLANEITLYKLGNTLQWTNNPYEQLIKPENLAHIMQNMGNAITAGGLTFSATGVGSVVGVPMSSFGTAMNSVGTAWEVGLQAYDAYNGINTNQNLINISNTIAFYTLQNLIEKKLLNGLDVTPKQMTYIKQTLGLELNYMQY